MENTKMKLTGKPSIDKPWLQFYPEQLRNVEVPKMTIEEFLKYKNQDENRTAFEYYGNKITWKTLIRKRQQLLGVVKMKMEQQPFIPKLARQMLV